MSQARQARTVKRQMGQFLTPPALAARIVAELSLNADSRVLEPSFGDGSFLLPLIDRFATLYDGSPAERLAQALSRNIYGVELDAALYEKCLANIKARYGALPERHNLVQCDFFAWQPKNLPARGAFDWVVGNPPFGGTIDPRLQDALDRDYGFRGGEKIKKETYSFFLVKSLDLVSIGGKIDFLCSDTFLTIRTMRGLRRLLQSQGKVTVETLDFFSDETKHPILRLSYEKTGRPEDEICADGVCLSRADIERTGNFSWRIPADFAPYFGGGTVGDFLIATSGMTIGQNELFVRRIENNAVCEPCDFEFFDDPITLKGETARARLGKISPHQREVIAAQEASGLTRRNVRAVLKPAPETVRLPSPDYRPYNKGNSRILYQKPEFAVYWKDEGDAVYTFKKNGNWYLRGVGGHKFFGKSGLTWSLVATRIHAKYLPEGFILDSGAPCAFLRPGVPEDELFFLLGWLLTDLANALLKNVLNHTRNIQGKDVERLPYPFWVSEPCRRKCIAHVRSLVARADAGELFSYQSAPMRELNVFYAAEEIPLRSETRLKAQKAQLSLFAEKRARYMTERPG